MENKETIEEAAERIYREYPNNPLDKPDWRYNRDVNCFKKRKAFISGAKWIEERMYSEEEVRTAILTSFLLGVDRGIYSKEREDKIIEQFKKK
jgi:hypothetical protein